ncbi:MAG: thioredoxin [Candidatus Levybacteria bacterium]|nr:thioredoxin [Candidatus Levybacteria bacterium]
MIDKLTDESFQKEVLEATAPVLVDFWAEWCQPCLMIAPVVDELAGEYGDKVKFGKINVDENINTPGNYGVMSIPTLIVFKDGKPYKTLVGVQGKDILKKAIDEALN